MTAYPEAASVMRDGHTQPLAAIDAALRQAVALRQVPGVVALAATGDGLLYEGAFGVRDLSGDMPMSLDTVFRIASMTKAVTSVAAMRLVERGRLALDEPLGGVMPELAAPQVLDGFDAAGMPLLRPAKQPITLRRLLTHTAGFAYEAWNADLARYVRASGMPSTFGGKWAAYNLPLVFDPGDRWEYGINIDWVGRIVETVSGQSLDAYFREHILGPLGMDDTGFVPSEEQRARQASVHLRKLEMLEPQPLEPPPAPEFFAGGGGLYSTGRDYIVFLQMLLNGGNFLGAEILRPETVAEMAQNQIGDLDAGILRTAMPGRSNDVDLFPGRKLRWGLGYMINVEAGPSGRSAGSLTWAGLFNSYFWIDPARRVTGVLLTQILPFADPGVLALVGEFERGVYDALGRA